MVYRFKCKECDHVYVVDLSGSEYFLPARCPDCGYVYQDSSALRRWLDDVKKTLEAQKDSI